ncbi:hypothetical protein [Spirosoma aerolatum]|uniref:hypothetical protein n=1 Tax=Spirosoma aerolatum TaxID=1211326 RepID=UPI0009AEF5E7|nr:hypothetical protein [Spirosoma aerolatum]
MKKLAIALLLISSVCMTTTINAQNLSTAEDVLNAYYKAIGGKKALLNIKDLSWKGASGGNGASFPAVGTYKVPFKQVITSSTPQGQVVYKFICDGKDATMLIGSNKVPMSRAVMDRYILTLQMMPELCLADRGVKTTFAGKESVEGKEAYKLTHTMPDGSTWHTYYDTQTGLKVKLYVPGQSVGEINLYADYRDVNGIKLPFVLYPGTGTLKIESYQLNTGISDDEFVIK